MGKPFVKPVTTFKKLFLFGLNHDQNDRYLNMSEANVRSGSQDLPQADWLEIVREQVGSLKYGVVEIVVHDSQVTQIEKTERLRLDKPAGRIPARTA